MPTDLVFRRLPECLSFIVRSEHPAGLHRKIEMAAVDALAKAGFSGAEVAVLSGRLVVHLQPPVDHRYFGTNRYWFDEAELDGLVSFTFKAHQWPPGFWVD